MGADTDDRVSDNHDRIVVLEREQRDGFKENNLAHKRLEGKVDAIAVQLSGYRNLVRGASWAWGLIAALGVWVVHEWHVFRDWFR